MHRKFGVYDDSRAVYAGQFARTAARSFDEDTLEQNQANTPQTFSDVACTVCGCVCDDLRLTFAGERLTHAEGACHLAEPWFAALSRMPDLPAARIEGKAATLEPAVER